MTLTSSERRPVFTARRLVQGRLEALRSASENHGVKIVAYCFMPDHLHLLAEGTAGSDVPRFVKEFKQRTAYNYRRTSGEALWQKSYYDHVLRQDEDVGAVARYVVGNPVRAGLARTVADYPYSGSFVWGKAILEA